MVVGYTEKASSYTDFLDEMQRKEREALAAALEEEREKKEQQRQSQWRQQRFEKIDQLIDHIKHDDLSEVMTEYASTEQKDKKLPEHQIRVFPPDFDHSKPGCILQNDHSLTDAEIEEQKQLVADYFPPSVEVVEAINNNGHRTVIFVGITAKESNAIEGLIEEKEQLRAEAARQQEKPSLPSHLSFLESDVEEALDPSVPATPPLSDHIKAPETPAKTATFSTEKATPHSYRQ